MYFHHPALQPAASRSLVGYAGAIGVVAVVGYAAGGGLELAVPVWVAVVAGAAIAVLCGIWLAHGIVRSSRWERRLAVLASTDADAYSTMNASGSTPADCGWNRLLELARSRQALIELEQAVAGQLTEQRGRGNATLLDSLADGVAMVDSAGIISYANSVTASLCGAASGDKLHGKTLAEAFGVDAATASLLNSPSSQSTIDFTLDGEGGQRMLRCSRRPGRRSDGESAANVWTIRDVTQQRLAEAMREKFLAAATHEFRTPLANIRAYAESLDMGHDIDPESRKRFYNIIQSESVRLSQLVDDLLDISRMQAGALAVDLRETDLGRLVDEASAKVQAQIREKKLHYRCELPPKFPKAVVDKNKLTAALVNLLGNAAKYTPEGGRVTFAVDVTPQKALFTVTDTGIGIAPEELPRICERFFRSNDERVREITGSGLGLSLTQEIAKLHGGDLCIESTLNKGSTFRLSIPLDTAA